MCLPKPSIPKQELPQPQVPPMQAPLAPEIPADANASSGKGASASRRKLRIDLAPKGDGAGLKIPM